MQQVINNADNAQMLEKWNSKPTQFEAIEGYIKNAINFGVITKEQGEQIRQNLMKSMEGPNLNKEHAPRANVIDFANLSGYDSQFFEERSVLKEYLKNAGVELDREEFEKIYAIVNALEQGAVEKFKANSNMGGNLKQANQNALSRLQTTSAAGAKGGIDAVKNFTLEEIGKMSPREFRKNEPLINKQLVEGKL